MLSVDESPTVWSGSVVCNANVSMTHYSAAAIPSPPPPPTHSVTTCRWLKVGAETRRLGGGWGGGAPCYRWAYHASEGS